jgi:hypothetical protein
VPMRPRTDIQREQRASVATVYAGRPLSYCPGALMPVRTGEQARRALCNEQIDANRGLCASCGGIETEARRILKDLAQRPPAASESNWQGKKSKRSWEPNK